MGKIAFPEEINDYIKDYSITLHPYHETANIYVLTKDDETIYLKTIVNGNLKQEYEILEWIDGRIPVPEALKYLKVGTTEYLITSGVKGTPVYQLPVERRVDGVRVLAEALKMIHSLDTKGCPRISTIDDKIKQARKKVDTPYKKSKLADLEKVNVSENIMFTHGDYCLPNILVTDDGDLGGVIDWDYGGIADQYVDFVMCSWSLSLNYDEKEANKKWIPLFYKVYGLEKVDKVKLNYYERLSNLFE